MEFEPQPSEFGEFRPVPIDSSIDWLCKSFQFFNRGDHGSTLGSGDHRQESPVHPKRGLATRDLSNPYGLMITRHNPTLSPPRVDCDGPPPPWGSSRTPWHRCTRTVCRAMTMDCAVSDPPQDRSQLHKLPIHDDCQPRPEVDWNIPGIGWLIMSAVGRRSSQASFC